MKSATKKLPLSKSEREARKKKIVSFCILLLISLVWVFPLIYMLGLSFKTTNEIILYPTNIFPTWGNWTIEHYQGFFQMKDGHIDNLPMWMINSAVITFISVGLGGLLTVFAAYSFVFLRWKGKIFIYAMIIASMSIPGVIGYVPQYSMYCAMAKSLNLSTSFVFAYAWIIGPGLAGAFNLLLTVNAYKAIPNEIVESARSDGSSEFEIFWHITTPLIKSTIIVCALFAFAGSWNNLMWPQLILSGFDSIRKTITVQLTGYINNQDLGYKGLAMATCVFSIIPTFLVYIFAQNRIIEGLATTGVKK